jgi:hypothetical protein
LRVHLRVVRINHVIYYQSLVAGWFAMAYAAQVRGITVFNNAVDESRRIYQKYFCLVRGVPDHRRLGESLLQLHETLTRFDDNFGFSEIPPVTDARATVEPSFAQLTQGLLILLAKLEEGLCRAAQNTDAVARIRPGHNVQAAYDVFWVQDIVGGLRCYAQSIGILMESIQRLVCPVLG